MRNIKTTLRTVRNTALLFAAASAMTCITSCKSDNEISTGENPIPEATVSTASYTVHGANQNRVHNYGSTTTRAGQYVDAVNSFFMPECPTVPATAEKTTGLEGHHIVAGKDYVVPAGTTFDKACQLHANCNYYVEGTWDLVNGFWGVGEGAKLWILPGGTVKLGSTIQPGLVIYNYGKLTSENPNGICISRDVTVYSATNIEDVDVIGVNSDDWNQGKPGKLYCKGTIQADKEVRLNGEVVACAFIADKIDIHSTGTIKASYFKADDLTLNTGNVVLDNNGLVEAKKLNITNQDTRFTVNGTNAVVAADVYNTNNLTWPVDHFGEGIAVDFGKTCIDWAEKATNEFTWRTTPGSQVVYVPEAACHASYGTMPTPDENPGTDVPDDEDEPIVTPEIRLIVDIESLDEEINHGDHDHGTISATCINFASDGTAYASYHLRGNGDGSKNPNYVNEYAQKGCIEVIKNNAAGEFALGSYMIAPDYDFNHAIIDGDNIITVGNAKKMGAFIASLPKGFEAAEGVNDNLKVKELTTNVPLMGTSDKTGEQIKVGYTNAGDGNCVVRQGNYYYVATYEGYGPINTDFSRVKDNDGNVVFTKTNGSAKHISINGGNMAVIALDSYDKTSSTASVYKFGASDYSFATVLAQYDAVGTVSPVDGKNVVAVDGDNIYACLSKGGLVRVNDGKKWQRGANGNVPVNGMAFDNEYIYVANGSFISVLDKATMEEVCYYHDSNLKSANYIALNNGKIYVAFGENGIRVFQLVKKQIEL